MISIPRPAKPEETKARETICSACHSRQYRDTFKIYVCGECHCPLFTKSRVVIQNGLKSDCPLGKWPVK